MNELNEILKNAKKPMSFEKICDKLHIVSFEDEIEIYGILNEMVDNYLVIKTSNDNYVSIEKTSFRKGKFYSNNDGSGTVIVKNKYTNRKGEIISNTTAYKVLEQDVNGAIDGDLVFINLYSKSKNSPVIADIKKIIDRKLEKIVGEVEKRGNEYFVKSLDRKNRHLNIKLDAYEVEGIKVGVDLIQQLSNTDYIGKVTRRFNHKFDPTEDLLIEAFKHGVVDEFSNKTLEEIKSIPNKVLDKDKIGREDLTNEEIFTIDGSDTKDIDDALSCKIMENGNYLVGVHIADVSHYVKESSSIDQDAYKRGTSVYLPGSVIPMLPRELSNGICSLNPGVERLAISCFMEVTSDGKVIAHDIKKSVIKSNIKMTYEEVNKLLHDRGANPIYNVYSETLHNLNKLSLVLRKNRIKNGAIDFDRKEIKLDLDDNKKIKEVKFKNSDLGENLIEEFMILANETVDKHLVDRGYNPLHRVHANPIPDKMDEFIRLLNAIGNDYTNYSYLYCCDYPEALQDLQKHICSSEKLSSILNSNLIKCMSKAKYSGENIGHYGLAKDYYCHFTSPIRRYPDLVIHRLLKLQMNEESDKKIQNDMKEIGFYTSKMERVADKAESECNKMLIAEYMKEHIGEEYYGIVTSVDDCGMNIQLDNLIEGRVRARDLKGKYVYKEKEFKLVSDSNEDDYTVGDYLKLELINANKEKKAIDFKVIEKVNLNEEAKILKK